MPKKTKKEKPNFTYPTEELFKRIDELEKKIDKLLLKADKPLYQIFPNYGPIHPNIDPGFYGPTCGSITATGAFMVGGHGTSAVNQDKK